MLPWHTSNASASDALTLAHTYATGLPCTLSPGLIRSSHPHSVGATCAPSSSSSSEGVPASHLPGQSTQQPRSLKPLLRAVAGVHVGGIGAEPPIDSEPDPETGTGYRQTAMLYCWASRSCSPRVDSPRLVCDHAQCWQCALGSMHLCAWWWDARTDARRSSSSGEAYAAACDGAPCGSPSHVLCGDGCRRGE